MTENKRRHFYQSIELLEGSEGDPYNILYVPRIFAQHPFPKSDINRDPYWAVNGDKVLIIQAGYEYSPIEEKVIPLGLPFGMIPRLLILMISTKVKRTGNRSINLSKNISELFEWIGYEVSGGRNGSLDQFHNQIKRLLECRVSHSHYKDFKDPKEGVLKRNMGPIDEIRFWESSYNEERNQLKEIRVKIHEHFYNEIINHAFPIKQADINKLRPSTLAIDLYLFLSHRVYNLQKDAHISWKDLNKQFGSNYSNYLDFGRRARKYLRKIKNEVYPEINFVFEPGRLVLKKSPTPVKKLSTNEC